MPEPWIRYKPKNEGKLYKAESTALPYTEGLDPLVGVMETVDYLTTAPVRTGVNESLKVSGPWNKFKAFGKGVVNSFKNPGSSPNSSEVANRAGLSDEPIFKNKGRVSFGGVASKLSPADLGGFVGEQVLDPSNLVPMGKAMMLGATATGFKDAKRVFSALWDKKPRFEISDANVGFKNPKLQTVKMGDEVRNYTNLGDLIDHPELFDNYPELKDLSIKISNKGDNLGEFKPKTGFRDAEITLRKSFARKERQAREIAQYDQPGYIEAIAKENVDKGFYKTIDEAIKDHKNYIAGVKRAFNNEPVYSKGEKETLLHEIQHWVQQKEGFAQGASPGSMPGWTREDFYKYQKEFMAEREPLLKDFEARGWDKLDGLERMKLLDLRKEREGILSLIDKLEPQFLNDGPDTKMGQYKRLAGEAEARDTEARINMSEAERMRTQPLQSTGLALNDLIVKGLAPVGPWMLYKRNQDQNKKETAK